MFEHGVTAHTPPTLSRTCSFDAPWRARARKHRSCTRASVIRGMAAVAELLSWAAAGEVNLVQNRTEQNRTETAVMHIYTQPRTAQAEKKWICKLGFELTVTVVAKFENCFRSEHINGLNTIVAAFEAIWSDTLQLVHW